MNTLTLGILGFLFGSGVFLGAIKYIITRVRAVEHKNEAVCLGVQALLRDRMIENYNHYSDKGYAPIYAKDNYSNMWKQYETLGENGVMEGIYNKFMNLPEKEVKEYERLD